MTASVIEKLETQSEAHKLNGFRALAAELHAGKNIPPDVVGKKLAECGRNWQDLKTALAELSANDEHRKLAAKCPQLQAESKRLAVIVAGKREELVQLLKAHRQAEADLSAAVRDAEAVHQEAHKHATAAASAEEKLLKLAATESPDLHRELQTARMRGHAARQRKTAAESRLKDLPGTIANLKYRIGGGNDVPKLTEQLETAEAELPRVWKELDSLVNEIPKLEQAEAAARKALLTAMAS